MLSYAIFRNDLSLILALCPTSYPLRLAVLSLLSCENYLVVNGVCHPRCSLSCSQSFSLPGFPIVGVALKNTTMDNISLLNVHYSRIMVR